jgi:hypothetical protein
MAKSSAVRVGVITAVQFAAATAIVLWPVGSWAQGGILAEFTPTIDQKVDARPSPAKVTPDEESALTSKGYVKIGTISASKEGRKEGGSGFNQATRIGHSPKGGGGWW